MDRPMARDKSRSPNQRNTFNELEEELKEAQDLIGQDHLDE